MGGKDLYVRYIKEKPWLENQRKWEELSWFEQDIWNYVASNLDRSKSNYKEKSGASRQS